MDVILGAVIFFVCLAAIITTLNYVTGLPNNITVYGTIKSHDVDEGRQQCLVDVDGYGRNTIYNCDKVTGERVSLYQTITGAWREKN